VPIPSHSPVGPDLRGPTDDLLTVSGVCPTLSLSPADRADTRVPRLEVIS
jgi:hypothetical protein